ncbi:MAG: hypothetical protein PWQ55_1979 [Chloroflexota bacterium]|nr:hypothetical protein [Chloroflexota bacterium]
MIVIREILIIVAQFPKGIFSCSTDKKRLRYPFPKGMLPFDTPRFALGGRSGQARSPEGMLPFGKLRAGAIDELKAGAQGRYLPLFVCFVYFVVKKIRCFIKRRSKKSLTAFFVFLFPCVYGVQLTWKLIGPNHWWLGLSTYSLAQ